MRTSNQVIDRIYVNRAVRSSDYKMSVNHSHNYFEIFYILQGNTRFFVDDKLFDLHAGDYLLIPPLKVHYNRYITQTNRINIYFRRKDLLRGNEFVIPGLDQKYLDHVSLYHTPSGHADLLEKSIDRMLHEDHIIDANTEAMMQLLLQEFFILTERYSTSYDGYSQQMTLEGDLTIQDAAKYISENYHLPITLNYLAEQSGMSPSYFSKRFHLITGMGMKEYLTYVRLTHAEAELLSTNHTIKEIAENSGFSDSNYFKDAFKKEYGYSPRNYRNSRKTNLVEGYPVLPPDPEVQS